MTDFIEPTVADIRSGIASALASVADIGVVHPYERYSSRMKDLKDHYLYSGRLQGWFVRRSGSAESLNQGGRTKIIHRWQIRGYMALADDGQSELVFDSLVEAISERFRSDETLGGLVETIYLPDSAGIQVDDIGPVMFAGVLCHAARLSLRTQHHHIGQHGLR